MPAELGLHRRRHLALVQRIKCIFERRVIDAGASEAQVTALVGGAWILRDLLGDDGKVFTALHSFSYFIDLGLGLSIAQLTTSFDKDMRGAALLGQAGDLLLIQLLQLLIGRFDLIEE